MRVVRALALLLVLAGAVPLRAAPGGGRAAAWQVVITPRDRARLRGWRDAWLLALSQARAGGAGERLDAAGDLLLPDAALEEPMPPNGRYRCRLIKLGAQAAGAPTYVEQPPLACRIDGDRFTVLSGAQRPAGWLWPYDGAHALFLGAMTIGDERGGLDYGRDSERDMVGLVERFAPARWRIVLPRPRWGSQLDVIELLPAN